MDLPKEVGLKVSGKPGELVTVPAAFGPPMSTPGVTGPLVPTQPLTAHPAVDNAPALAGAVALVKRGGGPFAQKVLRAQEAGAVAVVVVQNSAVWPYTMTDSANTPGITIPAVMVDEPTGDALVQAAADAAAAAAAHAEHKSDDPEPLATLTASLLCKGSSAMCVVCQEAYEADDVAIQMPCLHVFHRGCLLEWLQRRNSCPMCRRQLPTDDKEYEARLRAEASEAAILNSMYL